MNQKCLEDDEPSVNFFADDASKKSKLKMLVAILNRDDGEVITELFMEQHCRFHLIVLAEGTSRSAFMNLIGLGSTERVIAICVSHSCRIDALIPLIEVKFNLRKPGNGIAFTIPLSGFATPTLSASETEKWNNNMEKEVDEMSESITHDLILALVNHGNSEDLVAAARQVGAKGGTVVNARRTSMEDAVKFFGITVQEEREIVAIITKREDKAAIMNKLNELFGIDKPAHGIILSLPVDSVAGLGGMN